MMKRVLIGSYKSRQVIRAVPMEIWEDTSAMQALLSEIEDKYLRDRQRQINHHLTLLIQAGAGCKEAAKWLGWLKPLKSITATLPPYNRLRRLDLPWYHVCQVCGADFYGASPRAGVCSSICARERRITIARNWRANRKKAPAKQATCKHCQSTFTPARADAKFCSVRCRVAEHRKKAP